MSTRTLDFSVLWTRKKILVLSGLSAACIFFAIGKTLPLGYSGDGGMIMDSATATANVAAPDDSSSLVQTQVDVLQSKGVIGRVVNDLRLTEDGLIPKMRLPSSIVAVMTAAANGMNALWRSINDSGAAPPKDDPKDALITYVQKHLTIESKEKSKLITLKFVAATPAVAAAVTNAIMNTYLARDSEGQQDKVARVDEYIQTQSNMLRNDITEAQQKLSAFVSAHNMPEVQGSSAASLQLAKDQEQLAIARDQLALRQAALDTLKNGGGVAGAEETLESQTIQALKNYEAQVVQQLGTLGPNDPRRGQLQAGLSSIRSQLARENDLIYSSIARNVAIAKAKVTSLETAVRAESGKSQDMSVNNVTLKQLTSDLDGKRQLYQNFLTQSQTLRTNAEGAASAHILFQAATPTKPVTSYGALSIILGLLVGTMTSAGTILMKDFFGTRVHTTMELELATGLPTFGSLPDVKQLRLGGVQSARKDTVPMITETFRSMWITMRSEQEDKGTSVVITSSEIGEGKTMVTTALAQRFADDGFRVLLIDADLRRPRLAEVLKLKPDYYLESVLTNEASIEDATVHNDAFGFDCLFSNGRSRNPAKVLLSEPFKRLLATSKDKYDFVILDSPPVLHVADPVLLANLCDYILFVVEAGRMSSDLVAEATRRFSREERERMLTMLTRVRPSKMDKRDYYSGYGHASEDFDRIGHDA